ncbi:hypothetical protein GCM10027048_30790 [Hymenobacter coalescens]
MPLRIIAPAAALLLSFCALAVPARAQFSIGPRLGLNASTFHVSKTAPGERHRLLPGVQFGVVSQIRMGRWALQPGLLISQKGSRDRTTQTITPAQGAPVTFREKHTRRIPYVELPVHLAYQPRWAHGFHAFAGPYLAVGIGGYFESDPEPVTINGYTLERFRSPVSYPTLLGGSSWSVRWEDVGLNAGVGYQKGRLLMQLQQSFGATNVWPDKTSGLQARRSHRVSSLTLTYLFGPKPHPDFMLD